MTIIEGKEGITVVDPLVSAETSHCAGMIRISKTAAQARCRHHLYHSHADHWRRVRRLRSGRKTRSESVCAGSRRSRQSMSLWLAT